jgi:hypothetical protein
LGGESPLLPDGCSEDTGLALLPDAFDVFRFFGGRPRFRVELADAEAGAAVPEAWHGKRVGGSASIEPLASGCGASA